MTQFLEPQALPVVEAGWHPGTIAAVATLPPKARSDHRLELFEHIFGNIECGWAIGYANLNHAVDGLLSMVRPGARIAVSTRLPNLLLGALRDRELARRLHIIWVDSLDVDDVAQRSVGTFLLLIEAASAEGAPEVSEISRRNQLWQVPVVVDATNLGPAGHNAIQDGATFVFHGSMDIVAGEPGQDSAVLVCADEEIARELCNRRAATSQPEAQQLARCLTGLRNVSVRMERACETAIAIAGQLERHPRVTNVTQPRVRYGKGQSMLWREVVADGSPLVGFEVMGCDAQTLLAALTVIAKKVRPDGVRTMITSAVGSDARDGVRFALHCGIEELIDISSDLGEAISAALQ